VNPEAKPKEQRFKTRWYPDEVVSIPENEAVRYRREYARALRDGALRKRSADDWRKWSAAQDAESKKRKAEKDKAKAEAKAAAQTAAGR